MNSAPYPHAQRRLAILFSVPFAFSLLFFAVTIFSDHTELELRRVQDASECIAHLRSLADDIEIGEHGFLLTGAEQYLIPLEQASRRLKLQAETCKQGVRSQPAALQTQVAQAASLVTAQSEQASRVLNSFYRSGPAAALDIVKSEGGADAANRIRRAFEVVENALARREADVVSSQRGWNRWSYLVFVCGTAVMVVVMLRLYHSTVTYLRNRDELQERLRELNAALESEVEQRTKDLKTANEELQQFAYVASHDLQEPLRTITSFTQLLEQRYRKQLDDDADEFLGYIVTAARRMTDLINGLLALARLRKSGRPTVPVPFDAVMQDVQSNLAAAVHDSSAVITWDALPSLVVDRLQISQLLQNLISNAIKYRRPDEAPRIHVSAARDETQWVFRVKDNGRGFNQQYADRIFGLFQRIPSGEVDGTGIGLSIARRIVDQHGGRIWAESTEGVGSTFLFSLPLSLETSRGEAKAQEQSGAMSGAQVRAHSADGLGFPKDE